MKRLCAGALCLLLLGLCACGRQAAPEESTAQTTATEATMESATGYFDMVWGWECPQGEYASYINKIYHTEHGTAGSSGKAAISAVTLLEFSNAFSEEHTVELATAFASMNDSQARFFASQWLCAHVLAIEALRDPELFHQDYDWAGLKDFDAAAYTTNDLNHLDGIIAGFLCREEMQ